MLDNLAAPLAGMNDPGLGGDRQMLRMLDKAQAVHVAGPRGAGLDEAGPGGEIEQPVLLGQAGVVGELEIGEAERMADPEHETGTVEPASRLPALMQKGRAQSRARAGDDGAAQLGSSIAAYGCAIAHGATGAAGADRRLDGVRTSEDRMDLNSFIIYLHELRNQCLFTQASLHVFNQSLEQNVGTSTLAAGQAALTSASQAASILWPPRARARRRGEVLREKLQLPDSHAMADRRFVELWERADEKLDDWVKTTKNQRVLIDFVGSPSQVRIPDLKEEGVYRMYDTDNKIFVFRGIGYNLANLAKAIGEIGRRADALHTQIMQAVQQQQGAQPGQAPQPVQGAPAQAEGSAEDIAPAEAGEAGEAEIPSPVAGDTPGDESNETAKPDKS